MSLRKCSSQAEKWTSVSPWFQVSINTGNQWVTQNIALPQGMQAVLFIPDFESLTSETRAAGAYTRSLQNST